MKASQKAAPRLATGAAPKVCSAERQDRTNSLTKLEVQAGWLMARYAISPDLAVTLATLAFPMTEARP